ncbi:hypothetical protein Tco_0259626 [Tanacetum coccineum]
MNNLEKQLNKETLHEKDSKSDLIVIKVQFDKFLHSEEVHPLNYDGRHVRENFTQYTHVEAQSFKDLIIQHMDSIKKCIVKRALHDQEIQNRLKRLNDGKLQIQDCKLQEKQSNTSNNESNRPGNKCCERSNSGDDTDIRPSYDTEPMAEVNSNTIHDSSYMCNNNEIKADHYADDNEDECVVLANLIANLKLDIDENKNIQKQLRKANASLTHELNECKSALAKSNDIQDRCRSALHGQDIEHECYKKYNNCQIVKEEVERKLKSSLDRLAQQNFKL